jgi:tRNA(Ile)-lysidine synthase TilS/MesJ
LLSGGVDSTLLLFLLMKQRAITEIKIPIKCFIMSSPTTAHTKVISWISSYFNEEIPYQIMPKYFIREAVKNILSIEPGYVYSGCNLVLENEFTPTRYLRGDTPPVRGDAYSEHHIRPFIDIAKDELIKEYENLGILDLLKITVSCGISDDPCGECYFCLERQWGINKSGILL